MTTKTFANTEAKTALGQEHKNAETEEVKSKLSDTRVITVPIENHLSSSEQARAFMAQCIWLARAK